MEIRPVFSLDLNPNFTTKNGNINNTNVNIFSQFTLRFDSSIYDSNLYNAKYLQV